MGQQQLLLVILVTILVGIATVVGINVFGTSAQNANQDAVRNDIAQIASSSQGWMIKPGVMGGGGNSFVDIAFDDITFPADSVVSGVAYNLNGTYEITASTADNFTLKATPSSSEAGDVFFEATISSSGMEVDDTGTVPSN